MGVYDGPRTAEMVRDPVNTPFHDWLGYDAPEGVHNAGTWKDDRPNVGRLISPESFFHKNGYKMPRKRYVAC